MGMTAALKFRQVVDNAEKVLAIELLCAAQGLEYRAPLKPARRLGEAFACVRTVVPALGEDRVLSGDIEAMAAARKGREDSIPGRSSVLDPPLGEDPFLVGVLDFSHFGDGVRQCDERGGRCGR